MNDKAENIITRVRRNPAIQNLIPLEATLSMPVPVRRGARLFLRFLVYLRGRAPRGQPRPIYRPFARFTVSFPDVGLVEYVHDSFGDDVPVEHDKPIGYTDPQRLQQLSMVAYDELCDELLRLTVDLAVQMGEHIVGEEERSAIRRYAELADLLIEPVLRPYLETLNPEFFAWLRA